MTTRMELVQLVVQALAQTSFRTEDRAIISAEEMCQTLSQSYWGAPDRELALSARPEVSDDVVDCLAAGLHQRLDAYVDASSGRIGHSFRVAGDEGGLIRATPDHAVEIQSRSHSRGLARALIRAAAVVGPEAAAGLLDGWARGEPLRFKICLVLAGLYVDQPLELAAGLRVYSLPTSSEGLPLSMPATPRPHWQRVSNMLGHTVLEIDAHTCPVFFQPPREEGQYPPLETLTILQDVKVDTFLTALSLVCNRRVEVAWSWNDCGDAAAFATEHPTGLAGPGPMTLRWLGKGSTHDPTANITEITDFNPPSPNLDANLLSRTWAFGEELQRRIDTDPRFRIAVRRWEQSTTPGASPEDRAVDLRIALESLYLNSDAGELGFRLAITGARHLGTSLEKRREIRRTLGDFYGLASRIIHGTELNQVRNSDTESVKRASRVCRDGILRIVEEKHQPNWSDLVLE